MANSATDDLCINTIRALAIDATQRAGSGHPGAPMGAAAMAYTLWTRFLRHDPADPEWWGRDRFILSPGHASLLLYALLHLTGYGLTLDEIARYRQLGSRTPGHPERGLLPGAEVTTGPLGAGFAMGIGMGIAEHFLAGHFNRPGHEVVDHRIYGFVSDGDLMEGVSSEAASLAGSLGLGKLVYLYDDNDISIEGSTDLAFSEQVDQRFRAYGWHVDRVDEGNDVEAIAEALQGACDELARPSLIVVKTQIAFGSPHLQGTAAAHGSPLGDEEARLTKEALGWPVDREFYVPDEAQAVFRRAVDEGARRHREWDDRVAAYAEAEPQLARQWRDTMEGRDPPGWREALPRFATGGKAIATREASGQVLNALIEHLPTLVGGSADLAPSTRTELAGYGDLGLDEWCGHNIHFGVREHAMGNIVSGMALHGGVLPYAATFLTFSDYMRPAIRLAALQQAHAVFILTHDSVALGGDGPTHQPVEHLASLRAMPGLTVYRPADANETAMCWRLAVERPGPAALVLSRQGLPVLDDVDRIREGAPYGGYVLAEPPEGAEADVLLVATGSEVVLALEARDVLHRRGIAARVVSLPSWEVFEEQPREYRDSVLPPDVRARVSVEAGATFGWERYVGDAGMSVGIDRFGASGPGAEVMRHFGFTAAHVADVAEQVGRRRQPVAGGPWRWVASRFASS
ncbi:MAG: transketolase [Dehalococcoidia bacterium]|nr:transketolase [Dehalococcoidia bacterium]